MDVKAAGLNIDPNGQISIGASKNPHEDLNQLMNGLGLLDTNGDGKVSAEEFEKGDLNGDGKLDNTEAALVGMMDKNNDGKLSGEEMAGLSELADLIRRMNDDDSAPAPAGGEAGKQGGGGAKKAGGGEQAGGGGQSGGDEKVKGNEGAGGGDKGNGQGGGGNPSDESEGTIDGGIDLSGLQDQIKTMMNAAKLLDTDGDGKLSESEIAAGDLNDDGVIDLEEAGQLNALDADGNGELGPDALAALKERKEQSADW